MSTQEKSDNREVIPVDLSDDEFMHIARMAHERDITFNKMVEIILTDYMNATRDLIPTLTDEVPKT